MTVCNMSARHTETSSVIKIFFDVSNIAQNNVQLKSEEHYTCTLSNSKQLKHYNDTGTYQHCKLFRAKFTANGLIKWVNWFDSFFVSH